MPQLNHAPISPRRPWFLITQHRNSRVCRNGAEHMETVWRSLSSAPRPRDRGRPVGGRCPRHELSPATADPGGEMATGQVVYVTPPAVPGKPGGGDGSQGHPFHSVGAAIAKAKANGGRHRPSSRRPLRRVGLPGQRPPRISQTGQRCSLICSRLSATPRPPARTSSTG